MEASVMPPKGYMLEFARQMFRNQFGFELDPNQTTSILIDMRPVECTLSVTWNGVTPAGEPYGELTRTWNVRL